MPLIHFFLKCFLQNNWTGDFTLNTQCRRDKERGDSCFSISYKYIVVVVVVWLWKYICMLTEENDISSI